jgi:hypothetical protein
VIADHTASKASIGNDKSLAFTLSTLEIVCNLPLTGPFVEALALDLNAFCANGSTAVSPSPMSVC